MKTKLGIVTAILVLGVVGVVSWQEFTSGGKSDGTAIDSAPVSAREASEEAAGADTEGVQIDEPGISTANEGDRSADESSVAEAGDASPPAAQSVQTITVHAVWRDTRDPMTNMSFMSRLRGWPHSGKADEDIGALPDFGQEFCPGVLGYVSGNLKVAMCPGTFGMDDTFWDTLPVEVPQLFQKVCILHQ